MNSSVVQRGISDTEQRSETLMQVLRDKRENMNKLTEEAEDAVAREEQGTLNKITKKIST